MIQTHRVDFRVLRHPEMSRNGDYLVTIPKTRQSGWKDWVVGTELAVRQLDVIRRPPQRRLARLSATRGAVTAEYILLSGLVALGVVAGLLSFSVGPVQGALHTAGQRLTCFVVGASNCGGTSSPAPHNAAPPLHSEAEEIQRVEGGLEMDAERLDVDGVGVTELDPAAFSGMDRTEIRSALIEAGIPPTQAALRAGAIYRANHPGLDGVQVADTSGAWDFRTRTTPVEPVTGRPIPPVPPGHANTNTPPIRIVAGTAIDGTSRAPVQVVHPQPNVVGSAFKRAGGNILAALATGVVFAAADYYFTPEVARLPEVEGDFSEYQLDAEGRWLVDLDGNPVRRLSEHRLLGFSWGRHLVMNNDHELFYLHNNWTFRSHPVPPEAMLPGATAQDLVDAALAAQHNPEGWNTPWTATELFDPASHRADSLRRFVWTERGGATFEWDPEQQRWVQIGGVALLPEELLMAANSLGAGPPGALAPTLETTMSAGGSDGPNPATVRNGDASEAKRDRRPITQSELDRLVAGDYAFADYIPYRHSTYNHVWFDRARGVFLKTPRVQTNHVNPSKRVFFTQEERIQIVKDMLAANRTLRDAGLPVPEMHRVGSNGLWVQQDMVPGEIPNAADRVLTEPLLQQAKVLLPDLRIDPVLANFRILDGQIVGWFDHTEPAQRGMPLDAVDPALILNHITQLETSKLNFTQTQLADLLGEDEPLRGIDMVVTTLTGEIQRTPVPVIQLMPLLELYLVNPSVSRIELTRQR